MRYWRNAFVVPMVFGLYLVASVAGQEKSKPPPLPKIDPGQARLTATLGGLDGPGFDVAYHPQTNILAAGCEFGTVQYWEEDVLEGVRQGGHTPNVLKGHQGPVLEVAWNGGPFLASAGADKKIILWSMPDGKPAKTIPVPTVVRALAMSPDGKTLAASNDDNSIDLYDVASGKPRAKLTAHTDWVTALCFSPDGKLLASGGLDSSIRLWDAGGRKIRDISTKPPVKPNQPPPPDNHVLAIAFSPDGKVLAAGTSLGQILLINSADGKTIRTLTGHTSSVTGLAFHPGGIVLASASKDRTVRLWNPANGQMLKSLTGHEAWVQGLVFARRGTLLASVGADRTVRLWSLEPPSQ